MRVLRQSITVQMLIGVALLCGCSNQPKDPFKEIDASKNYSDFVPATALPVAKGVGTLTYTTPDEGVLYLIDTDEMVTIKGVQKPRVVLAGGVPRGTEVIFEPQEARIHRKGGEGVKLRNINPAHTFELRFDAGEKS